MKPSQALLAFVVVIVAYVVLTLTNHDATGLIGAAVTLLGLLGLGFHVERRTQEQNAAIAEVQTKATKIEQQTNGVLDKRIRDQSKQAMTEVLAQHGIVPADDDTDTAAT